MRRWLLLPLSLVLGACDGIDSVPLSDAAIDASAGDDADASADDASDANAATDSTVVPDEGTPDAAPDATPDATPDTAIAPDATPDAATDTAIGIGTDAASCAPTTPPEITRTGTASGKLLLKGTIVGPSSFYVGEVLVEGDTITCAAPSCASMAGAATATVVDTHGIVFPGLIDTHNHILFDVFDETDWAPTKAYANHNQWGAEPRYAAMVDAKQWMNGELSPTLPGDAGTAPAGTFGCEMEKFGELKALVAGTTSILGAATPVRSPAPSCYASLARSVEQAQNDLGIDKIQVATLFPPTKTSADGVCANFASDKTDAYLIHVAEGIDATALAEFAKLGTVTTTASCLYAPQTTIVHGTALGDAEFTTMATARMGLTWSPRSNVFLYGGGTDFTKTTNVPLAMSKGINVALAPDWSMGGSQNLLDELRFADKVDNAAWGNKISPEQLARMVTINAARNLGLDAVIGSIEVGKKADLMVIGGDPAAPYDALLATTPREVRLVMVGGVPLYGDATIKAIGPAAPGCETIDVCCASKFVCVAEAGGTGTDKLGQTYAQITAILEKALTDFDAFGLTSYKFAPLTPLVRCP